METKETRFGAPQDVRERLENANGFTVAAERCKECLFSSSRLTDKKQAAAIIKSCAEGNTYFSCHRFAFNDGTEGDERTGMPYTPIAVCCRAFYDSMGHVSQQIRMADRMGIVKFVDDEGNVVDA